MSEEQKLDKALEQTNTLPDSHFGEETALATDLVIIPEGTIEVKEKTEEQVLSESNTMNPEEIYLMLFGLYAPKMVQIIDKLPSNALRRVIKKLMTYPLNDKEFKATSDLEQNAFSIGDRVLEAKYSLVLHTMMEKVVTDFNKNLEKENNNETKENDNGKV